jgi:16S rRNA (guanine527-N7)-methyltransferase
VGGVPQPTGGVPRGTGVRGPEILLKESPEIPALSTEYLAGLITGAGYFVPLEAVGKLVAHAGVMMRWNRSIRLTAITSPEKIAVKHILDSLFLLAFSPFPGRILDFGSGAGYPGIPLAITLPGSQVVLLESSAKKCAFLSHVRRRLALSNAEVVQGRVEARNPLSIGRFEHIVTRATLPAAEAVALLEPYFAPGGRFLGMEGPAGKKAEGGREERRLPQGAAPGRAIGFELPLGMGRRTIREILLP